MSLVQSCTLLAALISTLASVSWAQLLSGDAVGFSVGECKVGNTTMAELGISEFNTTITPEPLTWTIGTERIDNLTRNRSLYDRSYFLGTPPSLKLLNSTSVRACALFFEGISGSLKFPGNRSKEYSDGTCGDAIGASCVSDLMSQSQDEMSNLLGTPGQNLTESAICVALESKIQSKALESCQSIYGQNWGNIVIRSLTGSEAAPSSQQINCHPTTGTDYDVSLVSSTQVEAPLDSWTDQLATYMLGITPVMTVFYPHSISTNGSLKSSEIYLSCMKIMGSTKGEVGGTSNSTGAAPRELGGSVPAMLIALAIAISSF